MNKIIIILFLILTIAAFYALIIYIAIGTYTQIKITLGVITSVLLLICIILCMIQLKQENKVKNIKLLNTLNNLG